MSLTMVLNGRVLGPAIVGAYLVSAYLVNREVPEPYLDEIFHIPQAQTYCQGNLKHWDPSITTPPGLYLLNTLISWITQIPCTPSNLRLLNVLLGCLALPWLCQTILNTQSPPSSPTDLTQRKHSAWTESYVIATFPLIFFFSLLYYTDIASLCSVLACYGLGKNRRYSSSALVGLGSLWFRQTNIVWVGFTTIVVALDLIEEGIPVDEKEHTRFLHKGGHDGLHITSLLRTIEIYTLSALSTWKPLLRVLFTYLPVLIAFGGFIIWNNGAIVLGHQEMHQTSRHWAQGLYFLAFGTGMGWPGLLGGGGVGRVGRQAVMLGMGNWRRSLVSLIILGLMVAAVHKGTVVHPFLLADNRHYFFYIWRRVFGLHWAVRYALVPGYLGCLWLWTSRLGQSQSLPWLVAFGICTSAVLVPTPLVEPRYFLVPFTLLRLHLARANSSHPSSIPKSGWLLVELIWNGMINVVTLYVFLTVKFKWEGWEGWMRFMW